MRSFCRLSALISLLFFMSFQILAQSPENVGFVHRASFFTHVAQDPIFSAHDPIALANLFISEPIRRGIGTTNVDVGFSHPSITSFHLAALRASVGKRTLDVGPGHGYYMAKALAAGAVHVTGLELQHVAADAIATTIRSYEKALGVNLFGKYRVDVGSILTSNLGKKFEIITAFNGLHLLTPNEAKLALLRIRMLLADGGQAFFLMNAPSGEAVAKAYYEGIQRKSQFPGFIKMTRTDVQEYELANGAPVRLIRKIQTIFGDAFPQDHKTGISPTKLELVSFSEKATNGNTGIFHAVMAQTMLRWDIETAQRLFKNAFLKITEAYYIDGANRVFNTLSDGLQSGKDFNIAIIATTADDHEL